MASSTRQARDMEQQLAALSEHVAGLTARLEAVEQRHAHNSLRSRFERWTLALFGQPDTPPVEPRTLEDNLAYHLNASRAWPQVYYWPFGLFYLTTALSLLFGSNALHVLPLAVRVVGMVLCLLAGLGNLSCLLIPVGRYQARIVAPTIAAAVYALVVMAGADLCTHSIAQLIAALGFWLVAIRIHIAWWRSIPGRISQRQFTMELLQAAREKSAQGLDGGAA